MNKYKPFVHAAFFGVLCAAVSLSVFSCGMGGGKSASQDILTQKVVSKDKIPVTVLVKHAFSINTFEKEAEKKFPNLELIQVGNYTSDRGIVEYGRRLEHDDLTDIVMTWPLDVGEQYWPDRLLDLSGMPFTSKYNVSMLNSISRNGKLYYLPGPAQVRGIVYNKTLFKENGWEVPKNFDEFVELCVTIEKSGIRSLQLGFGNPEVLDTAFVGYGYADCFSKPADVQWLSEYNQGRGRFEEHFGPALDTFQTMIDAGIFKKSDLDVYYPQREYDFFTRKCAMIEDSVLLARMGPALTGSNDEVGLMPFFNPNDGGEWARLYMVCFIGLNKKLALPENKAKYELVLKLMDYISSPEGQTALSADTGAMYSSVKNVPPPDVPEIEHLVPALEAGRYAVFPELKYAQATLREELAGLLRGTVTRSEAVRRIDRQNRNPLNMNVDEVLGTATDTFTFIEMGNFVTDIMRSASGAEIALFLDNGKDGNRNQRGISARFYKGAQTKADIIRIFPDLKNMEEGVLQKVTMTGENLLNTLEYSIPVDNGNTGWFYYFSGLQLTFDPTAEPGSRVKSAKDASGRAIDPDRVYTIGVMDNTVPESCVISREDTEIKIYDLIENAVKNQKTISPPRDKRFTISKPSQS